MNKANKITFDRIKKSPYKNQYLKSKEKKELTNMITNLETFNTGKAVTRPFMTKPY